MDLSEKICMIKCCTVKRHFLFQEQEIAQIAETSRFARFCCLIIVYFSASSSPRVSEAV